MYRSSFNARADADFRGALLAGFVEALLGFERAQQLAVSLDVDGGACQLIVGVIAFLQIDHLQSVIAHLHGVADVHFLDVGFS